MSFADMNVMALKKVARQTNVDLGEATKKADIIKALGDEGVTYEYYKERFLDVEDPDGGTKVAEVPAKPAEKKVSGKSAVIRLVTGWSLLETPWGIVTQSAPFLVVTPEEAKEAVATPDFVMSTPEEVKAAYGVN